MTKEIESKHLVKLIYAVDPTSDLYEHLLNQTFERKEDISELSRTEDNQLLQEWCTDKANINDDPEILYQNFMFTILRKRYKLDNKSENYL